MSEAPVILRIGSKLGPGGLASLQAGLDMVMSLGRELGNSIKEADKFALSMNRVDMAMVNMADSAAAGQIDTGVLIKQLAMIKEAAPGIEITSEQFKIMAARAAEFAEASGKDATEVFERMTNGIARAESEALKPFGIKLKENIDMTVTQNQAIRELTEGFEDFEYQAKTNVQRMDALNNNWDTFKNLLFASFGQITIVSKGLDGINKTLSETNKALSETSQSVKDYVFGFETWGDAIVRVGEAFYFLSSIMTMDFKAAAEYFQNFIARGVRDTNLLASHSFEQAQKAANTALGVPISQDPRMQVNSEPWTAGGWGSGPSAGGGGGGGGGDFGGSDESGLSFYGRGVDPYEFYTGQQYSGKPAKLGYGGPDKASGRFAEREAIQANVDAEMELLRVEQERFGLEYKIAELKKVDLANAKEALVDEQARLAVANDAEYQRQKAVELAELQNNTQREQVSAIKMDVQDYWRIVLGFSDEYVSSMNRMSMSTDEWGKKIRSANDDTMTLSESIGLVKEVWQLTGQTAQLGAANIESAMNQMLEGVRGGVAIEAGLKALMAAANAVEAGAQRQYKEMALHIVAAGLYTALAIKAAVGRSGGAGTRGSSASQISGSGTDRFTPDYGGSYLKTRDQETTHTFIFKVDDRGLFTIVQEGNTRARRNGDPSFRMEAA